MRFLLLLLLLAASLHGAITERYVSSAGTGSGTTIGDPMSYASMITILAVNSTASAGFRFNIKADGTYTRDVQDTWAADGTLASPIILRGYKTTPGDGAALGRTDGTGPLILTNMPTIVYTGTVGITSNSQYYVVYESLNITITGYNSSALYMSGNGAIAIGCRIAQANTGLGSSAINTNGGTAFNCDLFLTATSGGAAAATNTGTGGVIDSCLIKSSSPTAPGITTPSSTLLLCNTIYSCSGIGISMNGTSATVYARGNNIIGCAGDGIDMITGTTSLQKIIGNMITDNTGFGIDMVSAANSALLAYNRLRDNVAGSTNSGSDWIAVSSYGQASLDTGNTGTTATDYVNYAGGDFSLVTGSPALRASIPQFMSVGALQVNQAAAGAAPVQTSTAFAK